MVYSKYRTRLVIRIILLIGVGLSGILIFTYTPFWLVSVWFAASFLLQTVELIRFNERFRKSFKEFLLSIKQEDFASLAKLDESDLEMSEAYRLILEKFSDLRIEKESQYHYLQQVVEHVDTALLLLDSNERILLINRSAKELLRVTDIRELKSLETIDPKLVELILTMKAGQQELIKVIRHGRILNLSIRMSEFALETNHYKVVSLNDIRTELEEQEVDAWHKLVRVLTHEIRNSAIPITNMIGIAREFLVEDDGTSKKIPGLNAEELSDLVLSLKTAEGRSAALANFVESTRSLAQLPEPSFETLNVEELLKRLNGLYKKDLKESGIKLEIKMNDPGLRIKADVELIEQVIINLVKNAFEALEGTEEPEVAVSAKRMDRTGVVISVCDNGPGILPEVLDQIFIPFFSTKEKGSGIGLSLSRQIMKLHRGRIDVHSKPGEGTCFILEF